MGSEKLECSEFIFEMIFASAFCENINRKVTIMQDVAKSHLIAVFVTCFFIAFLLGHRLQSKIIFGVGHAKYWAILVGVSRFIPQE